MRLMRLDSLRRVSYTAALAALLLSGTARAAGEFRVLGVVLPGGSVKVDTDRYRMPQTYEEALKFYKQFLPPAKYGRKAIRNQAGVRAVHIDNPAGKSEWDGLNLYELPGGEVRLFIIAAAKKDEG